MCYSQNTSLLPIQVTYCDHVSDRNVWNTMQEQLINMEHWRQGEENWMAQGIGNGTKNFSLLDHWFKSGTGL